LLFDFIGVIILGVGLRTLEKNQIKLSLDALENELEQERKFQLEYSVCGIALISVGFLLTLLGEIVELVAFYIVKYMR